jgi:hypothetical protein
MRNRLWHSFLERLKFCKEAVRTEFKSRRWYRILTAVSALSTLLTFVGLFVTLRIPLPKLSWQSWLIAFLITLMILALLVMEAVYRFHERTVDELDTKYEERSRNIEKLSEIYGSGNELIRQFNGDRPSVGELKYWAERLDKALYACYGPSGIAKFDDNRGYSLKVPEAESEQSNWLYMTWLRVGDLIKDERPRENERPILPDEYYSNI